MLPFTIPYGRFLRRDTPKLVPPPPPSEQPPAIEAAIEAAHLVLREPDEDGHRVAVFSPALGGGFIYDCDEAARRIRKFFPELSSNQVLRALRHLECNIRLTTKPVDRTNRNRNRDSWVNNWRNY